jgi:ferritin-like metal-binding protein YciE
VESALEEILNLLLKSERAGVIALDRLAAQVENDELKHLLTTSCEDESTTVRELENLIRSAGGIPSQCIGPFAAKVVAAGTLSQQLKLLIRGEEWVARKVEEALALATASGPIHDYLQKMARRHRFEIEWGRAELIRLMNSLK